MKNKALRFLILCISLSLMSGCKDGVVSGIVYVRGNEPVTYLSLTTASGDVFKLTGDLCAEIIENYQNMLVTLKVRHLREAVGPDWPAELLVLEILEARRPQN